VVACWTAAAPWLIRLGRARVRLREDVFSVLDDPEESCRFSTAAAIRINQNEVKPYV
jgi:hypothetical protein